MAFRHQITGCDSLKIAHIDCWLILKRRLFIFIKHNDKFRLSISISEEKKYIFI